MTEWAFFFKGFIIGLSIAAPVGPIGLLCIQRTLTYGRLTGWVSGLGAATADALYGAVAGFGLSAITTFLENERVWIHVIGAVLMAGLAIRNFRRQPVQQAASATSRGRGLVWHHVSVFLLTITNPMTILSFIAVFAAMGVSSSAHTYTTAGWTVLGVFLGSATWWLVLSTVVSLIRHRLSANVTRLITVTSSSVILAFAAYEIWTSGVL